MPITPETLDKPEMLVKNVNYSQMGSKYFYFNRMLGGKPSLKGPVLADYGFDETFNESAEIEWVNKVSSVLYEFL